MGKGQEVREKPPVDHVEAQIQAVDEVGQHQPWPRGLDETHVPHKKQRVGSSHEEVTWVHHQVGPRYESGLQCFCGRVVEATLAYGIELQDAPFTKTGFAILRGRAPSLLNGGGEESKPNRAPVGRNRTQSGNTGITRWLPGMEAAGHSLGN